jgi:hypothetical protein
MTDDRIALRELLEKGSDATFLREMIGFAAERLMALETEQLCGAARGERTPERRNQSNATAATGRPALARSNYASRSCGTAVTSRPSWSHTGWRRRP